MLHSISVHFYFLAVVSETVGISLKHAGNELFSRSQPETNIWFRWFLLNCEFAIFWLSQRFLQIVLNSKNTLRRNRSFYGIQKMVCPEQMYLASILLANGKSGSGFIFLFLQMPIDSSLHTIQGQRETEKNSPEIRNTSSERWRIAIYAYIGDTDIDRPPCIESAEHSCVWVYACTNNISIKVSVAATDWNHFLLCSHRVWIALLMFCVLFVKNT